LLPSPQRRTAARFIKARAQRHRGRPVLKCPAWAGHKHRAPGWSALLRSGPSVPLALKFRSRIEIARPNGETSVDNTDISLGGPSGEQALHFFREATFARAWLGNGNALCVLGEPDTAPDRNSVTHAMAELLLRGFVSVFRTGRGRLPVAVLGGFRPRRSQEQFASQNPPNQERNRSSLDDSLCFTLAPGAPVSRGCRWAAKRFARQLPRQASATRLSPHSFP